MSSSKQSLASPRGMRDFYPDDMARRSFVFDAWTRASLRFGFEQYDSCVVETLDLLKRKSGEDIVQQIYAFADKSGRDLALRPEMTPTLARMIAARHGQLAFPVKWFTIAQCFRYERMTKGRRREHYQWNLDIVGEPAVTAEAEVLATAAEAMLMMGLAASDIQIRVNNRALLGELLELSGIPAEDHTAVFLALDKRDKVDELTPFLSEAGLDEDAIASVNQMLEVESLDDATKIVGNDSDAVQSLNALFELLSRYGIDEMVTFDISVIRGLGYYTGIVFEAYDAERSARAIFGGGRYDNLLTEIGGKPATAVGLGFGDVVIADLLEEKKLFDGCSSSHDVAVSYMTGAERDTAAAVASELRAGGQSVDLALHSEKPKQFFSRADKKGFRQAVYIGPDDVDAGSYRLKNMASGEERSLPLRGSEQ